jgi:transposase
MVGASLKRLELEAPRPGQPGVRVLGRLAWVGQVVEVTRRLRCRDCGFRLEAVPWARAGAAHTPDFENLVAWLAQQMAKTPIALLRIGWDTVGRIVERVVSERFDADRLDGLVALGVRKGQRYLTCVADHHSGAIVWVRPGRNVATLQDFFDGKTSTRECQLEASGSANVRQRLSKPRVASHPPGEIVRA